MKRELREKINRIGIVHKLAYGIKNVQEIVYYSAYKSNFNSVLDIRGIEKGKSCFIVGNGPSLKPADLERIKKSGLDSFACNKIYLLYNECKWRPTYYVAQDCYVNSSELLKAACAESLFISSELWHNIRANTSENVYIYRNIRMDSALQKEIVEKEQFVSYSFGSVLHTAIQLAIYMGYDTIYLVGVDHNYPVAYDAKWNIVKGDEVRAHFYSVTNASLANIELMTKGFNIVRNYAVKKAVKIYNATRGGKLEVFERVDLDALLESWGC